jgi:hypothetical protein
VAQGVSTVWAIASNNNFVTTASGTSLATPLVGGASAQVREAHPEWTVQQIRFALKSTADKSGTPDSTTYGWGRINVVKAIYGSPLGLPVYPKPFNLVAPGDNAAVSTTVVNFSWGQSKDPNGDPVTYHFELRTVTPDALVFGANTASTSLNYTGYLGPNKTYQWFVVASDPTPHARECRARFRFTTSPTTGVAGPGTPPPVPLAVLGQNQPNPVHFATEIPFQVTGGRPVSVTLRIFDAGGRLVRTLMDGVESAPLERIARWDGRDQNSRRVASGIYYYQLNVSGKVISKRMVVLR